MTNRSANRRLFWVVVSMAVAMFASPGAYASSAEKPVERHYVTAPNAPANQTAAQVEAGSAGCVSCHTESDTKTMHSNPAVKLSCTDCHGGNASIFNPDPGHAPSHASSTQDDGHGGGHGETDHSPYASARNEAHVLPMYPETSLTSL